MEADRDIDRRQHIGIHGWFQLTHPSPPHSLYITFALQRSKCLTQLVETTHVLAGEVDSRSHTHTLSHQAEAKTSFFNCYMGESDVSFSLYHVVMCIIINLGHEFSVLLMACKEKLQVK